MKSVFHHLASALADAVNKQGMFYAEHLNDCESESVQKIKKPHLINEFIRYFPNCRVARFESPNQNRCSSDAADACFAVPRRQIAEPGPASILNPGTDSVLSWHGFYSAP